VPRSASVTALEDSYLFRMERTALHELMGQQTDVARGIIQVLLKQRRLLPSGFVNPNKDRS